MATILRQAHTAVTAVTAAGRDQLDPQLLTDLRTHYDKAVHWGVITNRYRDWHDGNHPGYKLATRLQTKADQVWLFTTVFTVPWTNNAAEQAIKSPKLHQKVSGYWHTTSTLGAFCRVRSYLASTRGHGIRATDAIHTALTRNPWLPTPVQLTTRPHPVNGHLLTARDEIRSRAELKCWTSRKGARSPELSHVFSDPLREALEKVKSYEQADLLRERSVEEIQIILLRHYLIHDERDPGNPTR